MDNPVYDTIRQRASVRAFEDREVPEELVERLVRAGQQAPFTGQMYSFIASTDRNKREQIAEVFGNLVLRAPLFMLVCVDFLKLEKFISYRGRQNQAQDLAMLFLGIQDAAYAAQNIVIAAEAEGLGSCYLGAAPFRAAPVIDLFELPERVYPLVGLILGYPSERPDPRPRIPLEHTLFWDKYEELTDEQVAEAMSVMDAGLIREGYYAKLNARIPVAESEDPVDYDEYGWSEHVSRKYGVHGAGRGETLHQNLRQQNIVVDEGGDQR